MNERRRLIITALVLFALPFLLRYGSFFPSRYEPGELPVIDDSALIDSHPEYTLYPDKPIEGAGTVVFDLSHRNNIYLNDLTPLRDRLVKRGVKIIDFDAESGFSISALRGATALVVPSPTLTYAGDELEAVLDFVEDGGRLLLIADPTRTAELVIEDLYAAFFPRSAVPAVNSLANEFGITYVDDYIYNLEENHGNYRNVKLNHFARSQPLTDGLHEVVVFAAHSIRSDGTALIRGGAATRSPVRSGEVNLSTAVLAENQRVLALGDITFLTPPYHTIADNDHFMSNLADWLASAERDWDLSDFPYLFERPVDLIPLSEDPIDPQFIPLVQELDDALDETGLPVSIAPAAKAGHDSIHAGIFDESAAVSALLDRAGVEIADDDDGILIETQDLGTFPGEGSTLFLTLKDAESVAIVVMAEDADAVFAGLDMLAAADFEDCVSGGAVTLCTSGLAGAGGGSSAGIAGGSSICSGYPTTVPVAAGLPRLMSPEESQCMLDEGLAISLEFLSPDAFQEQPFEPGDVYTYPIEISDSVDALWFWGWCASPEQFEDNWENIAVTFSLNDVELPLADFVEEEQSDGDYVCRRYYVVVTEWPDGDFTLVTEIEFLSDLDDGAAAYEAGTRTIVYEVSVGG